MQKIILLVCVVACSCAGTGCGSFHSEASASIAWGDGLVVERSAISKVNTTEKREVVSEGETVLEGPSAPEPLLFPEP